MNWTTILKREYSLKDIILAHERVWFYYPRLPSHKKFSNINIFMEDAFKELFNVYLKGGKLSAKMRINLKKLASKGKVEAEHSRILSNLSLTGRVKQFPHKVNDYTLYYKDGQNKKPSVILILISKSDIKIYLYRLVVNFHVESVMAEWKGNMVYIGNKFKDMYEMIKEIVGINSFGHGDVTIKTRYVDDKGQAYIADSTVEGTPSNSIRNPIFNYADDFNGYIERVRDFWDKKLKQVSSENLTPLKTNPGVSE